MELIKKLLDQTTTDVEQITLINDMINQYDLSFTESDIYDTYKFMRYVITNVGIDNDLMNNYFSNYDFCYLYDNRDRDFLDYYYNYDSDKYRKWLISKITFVLGYTLENDVKMYNSLIRSIKNKEFKIQHSEFLIDKKFSSLNPIIKCYNDPETIDAFKTLLKNGIFNYAQYCKNDKVRIVLDTFVSELLSGKRTKSAV